MELIKPSNDRLYTVGILIFKIQKEAEGKEMKKRVVILLHEIYGVNHFIVDQGELLGASGFDVVTPNLLGRESFSYDRKRKAYNYFKKEVGFDSYIKVNKLVDELVEVYEKVFILGFSVGATLAWRCCENVSLSGILGFYGSRIKDFTELDPLCPTFLILSRDEHYGSSVGGENLLIKKVKAPHGFMDKYSKDYDEPAAKENQAVILSFFDERRD